MDKGRPVLTEQGLKEIKKQVKELEEKIIPSILTRLNRAKADGDLRENNPYISAKEDLAHAKQKLAELREVLRRARVISPQGNKIMIGSKVRIKINDQEKEIQITSSVEADPLNNKISIDSPIGKALEGKAQSETVKLPNGTEVEILEVKN